MTLVQWNWVMEAVATVLSAGFVFTASVSLAIKAHPVVVLSRFLLFVGLAVITFAFGTYFGEPTAKMGSETIRGEITAVAIGVVLIVVSLTALATGYAYSRAASKPKKSASRSQLSHTDD